MSGVALAIETGLALLCLALAALWLRARAAAAREAARARGLEGELARSGARLEEREYRIERFDVLWFPVVSGPPGGTPSVRVGRPYCPRCVEAMRVEEGGGVACPACGEKRAPTVTDVSVMDLVAKAALEWHRQGLRRR